MFPIILLITLCTIACSAQPLSACPQDAPASCPSSVPSYSATIAPILSAKCEVCHQYGGPGDPYPLGMWSDVHSTADDMQAQILSCRMPIPDAGVTLTDSERVTLLTWLVCGAPDN